MQVLQIKTNADLRLRRNADFPANKAMQDLRLNKNCRFCDDAWETKNINNILLALLRGRFLGKANPTWTIDSLPTKTEETLNNMLKHKINEVARFV